MECNQEKQQVIMESSVSQALEAAGILDLAFGF